MYTACYVVGWFEGFVSKLEPERTEDFEYLQDYIVTWLIDGDAVEATAGSYETFLEGIINIVAEWETNPDLLEYNGKGEEHIIRRTVTKLFRPQDTTIRSLERSGYEYNKFQQLYSSRR